MTDILNEYKFEEIKIGLEHKFTEKITNLSLDNFAKLSGDYNPLHMDAEYAKGTKFKKQVCHDMLLASFFFQASRYVYSRKKCTIFLTESEFSVTMLH